MINLYPGSSNLETAEHYSTKRTGIAVVRIDEVTQEDDFCSCIMQCIPCLPLLTDEVGTDLYKNDFFSLYQNSISGGSHTVHIVVDDEEILVTDNTYGKLYNGSAFYGYRFDAVSIWGEHGYGRYSAVLRNFDSLGNLVKTTTSPCYELQKFSGRKANRTVRIETRQSGRLLHGNNYTNLAMSNPAEKTLQYWPQQIRLPGNLKISGLPVENDRLVLNNDLRTSLQILDKMGVEYDLTLEGLSVEQAFPVIFDYLFSAPVYVTDYNVYNWSNYRNIRLVKTAINFTPRVAKRNTFVISMKREEENIEKFND
jgi:hypothetical protein